MNYKCLNCGHIFCEGEQKKWKEDLGEFWGSNCPVVVTGCPICGGNYEETKRCEICKSEHLENELIGNICKECISKYRYDVDMCYKVGSYDTDKIYLNCFLVCMFDKEEIEEILFSKLKKEQKEKQIDCEIFIKSDRDWFAEKLEKEVKKNENSKN